MTMNKDYYKILGVSKDATQEEIKKDFRRLALKYHPDRHKGDKEAEERFKEINEAYAVLGDPEKRRQYDSFGSGEFHQRFSQEDIFRDFDFSNIFRDLNIGFGGSGGFSRVFFSGTGKGVGLDDIFSQVFETSPHGGFGFKEKREDPWARRGQDVVLELPLTLKEMLEGGRKVISLRTGTGPEKIAVRIPRGIMPGKRIRVPQKGSIGPGGRGDLFLLVKQDASDPYTIKGSDWELHREITFSDACLGTEVVVPLPDGNNVKMKIPPGTQCGQRFRVKGKGLLDKMGNRGDGYVVVKVKVPKRLGKDERRLIDELKKVGL